MSATIADYMSTELVSFSPEDDIIEAMRRLLHWQLSGAPVLDQSGEMVGISSSLCMTSEM